MKFITFNQLACKQYFLALKMQIVISISKNAHLPLYIFSTGSESKEHFHTSFYQFFHYKGLKCIESWLTSTFF